MTPQEKAILKTYILADQVLAPLTSGPGTDYGAIVAALNSDVSPTQLAWRANVPIQEIDEAADYTVFDAVVAGKRDSWGFFLGFPRDFTRAKVRTWVTDVWGPAILNSSAEKVLTAATKKSSRAEFALGGVSKTTGTVTAFNRNWIGDVNINDIAEIFNA